MARIRGLRPLVFAAAAGLGVTALGGQAQAGLFDFLFGRSESPAPQAYYPNVQAVPLEMRVRPRRATVKREVPTKLRAASIDPVKNPTWYLDDPTLRRGDIVVLKGRILVYDGGSRGAAGTEDFTALKDSRLVSKGERERIQKMAGRQDGTTVQTEILPGSRKPTAAADPSVTRPAAAPDREASLLPKP